MAEQRGRGSHFVQYALTVVVVGGIFAPLVTKVGAVVAADLRCIDPAFSPDAACEQGNGTPTEKPSTKSRPPQPQQMVTSIIAETVDAAPPVKRTSAEGRRRPAEARSAKADPDPKRSPSPAAADAQRGAERSQERQPGERSRDRDPHSNRSAGRTM